ncbi:hypothetical protein [uncultured Desulfovibrio sp.]|uniref:hypothetical protein n=1 Tax=uncultured Desulfovibrio sp. TaxID=167968 RepID=UPI00265C9659|nr:hypothetical protein [uncultured Desulfovibrio sp.]
MINIAVFCFNRPDLLQQTLTTLAANHLANKAALTIFCDGPRHEKDEPDTHAVRELAKKTQGFASVEVVERLQNMGCAASIIDGLTEMFRLNERLIVIEDDIMTSPYTLRFLSEGLARYADNEKVFNISAWTPPHIARKVPADYPYDVYAIPRFNCWGWASWRDRFQDIDWDVKSYQEFKNAPQLRKAFNVGGDDLSSMLDAQMEGKLNAWDIRADYARFNKNMFGINPIRSYALNIGMGSGTHTTTATTYWDSDISLAVEHPRFMDDIHVDTRIHEIYLACYKGQKRSLPVRAINKLSRMLSGKNLIP